MNDDRSNKMLREAVARLKPDDRVLFAVSDGDLPGTFTLIANRLEPEFTLPVIRAILEDMRDQEGDNVLVQRCLRVLKALPGRA